MHGTSRRAGDAVRLVSMGARRSEKDGDPVINALDRHTAGIFTAVLRGWEATCPEWEE
jgi:hypothetical protein